MRHPAYGQVREVTEFASVLLVNNPNAMTLDGTNTWVVRAPGNSECAVIDPGPADADHLDKAARLGPVSLILLTHHHPDHTEGATEFAERTGAPIRAFDPALCSGAEPLRDGAVLDAGGVELRVLATAGHTADSVCLFAEHGGRPAVFTGDTILGHGTTIVTHPDGHLGSYLRSLRTLAELPAATVVLPGHGPDLPDIAEVASAYLAHRHQRLEQVRATVRDLGTSVTAREVVATVYADVDRALWPAAEQTVLAQLTYLRETGEL